MGSKNQTTASATQNSADPQAAAAYRALLTQAQGVASTPYQAYSGELTAPINSQQQTATNNINANAGFAQPYIQDAAQYANEAAQPITQAQIQQYQNPYTQSVVDATQAQFNNTNQQQQQQLTGNAIAQGALGGNRSGVAAANLAGQQATAQGATIAGLYNNSYQQALTAAQADNTRQQAAAYSLGNLGVAGQSAALSGAGAQLGAGTLEQQTQQAQDTAGYGQYTQAQAYPFQTTQWLAGLQTGVGSQLGGTSTGSTTSPGPNQTAQYAGLGLTAAGLFLKHGGRVPGFDNGGGVSGTPWSNGVGWVPQMNVKSGAGAPQAKAPSAPSNTSAVDPSKIINQAMGLANKFDGGDSTMGSPGVSSPMSVIGGAGDYAVPTFMRRGGAVGGFASGGAPWTYDDNGVAIVDNGDTTPSPLDPPSGRDRDTAVRTILSEAGNQGPEGQQAVGSVMRNRVLNGGFGGSDLYGVATAPNQFEPYNTAEGRATMAGYDPNSPAYKTAGLALDKAYTGDDPTEGKTMFYAPKAQAALGRAAPAWAKGEGQVIGDHTFYDGDGGSSIASSGSDSELIGGDRRNRSDRGDPNFPLANGVAAGSASDSGLPSVSKALGFSGLSNAAKLGLMSAGLGMLSSRSPNLGNAIGDGGTAGLATYAGVKKGEADAATAAQKLSTEAESKAKDLALRTRAADETLRHDKATEDNAANKAPSGYQMGDDGSLKFIKGGPHDPDQIASETTARTKKGTELDDDTVDAIAQRVAQGDTRAVIGLGRNPAGIAQIQKRVAEIFKDQGLDHEAGAKAILGNIADQAGRMTAERTQAGIASKLAVYGRNVDNAIGVAEQASADANRTSFTPVNKAINAWKTNTGDPKIVALGQSLNTLTNEYARAIGSGHGTVHDKEQAETQLNQARSHEQLVSIMNIMRKEIQMTKKSMPEARQEMRELYSRPSSGQPADTKSSAPAASTSAPPSEVIQNGYRYRKGPDGQYQAVGPVQ